MSVEYPINVGRDNYSGSDQKKIEKRVEYNSIALKLEHYINKQIEQGKRGRFLYSDIARETGVDINLVRSILFSVDCGHNGFTIS